MHITPVHVEDFLLAWLESVERGLEPIGARIEAEFAVAHAWGITPQTIHSQLVREMGLRGRGATRQFDDVLQLWLYGESAPLRKLLAYRFGGSDLERLNQFLRFTSASRVVLA